MSPQDILSENSSDGQLDLMVTRPSSAALAAGSGIEVEGGNFLFSLPDDVLVDILTRLDVKALFSTVSLVSRRAREIVTRVMMQSKSIDISSLQSPSLQYSCVKSITAKMALPALRCLCLDYTLITPSLCQILPRRCRGLRKLSLAYSSVQSDSALTYLLRSFPYLQVLDLSGVERVSDKLLADISRYLPHLVSINLSSCLQVTQVGIQALAGACTKLEAMVLCWQRGEGESLPSHFDGDRVVKAVCGIRRLRYLDILFDSIQVSSTAVSYFAHCRALELLRLGDTSLDSTSLAFVASSCPRLKRLDIRGSDKLSSPAVLNLIIRLPRLKELAVDIDEGSEPASTSPSSTPLRAHAGGGGFQSPTAAGRLRSPLLSLNHTPFAPPKSPPINAAVLRRRFKSLLVDEGETPFHARWEGRYFGEFPTKGAESVYYSSEKEGVQQRRKRNRSHQQ
eukprot:CAMPEP_0113887298 /NCGR_PEP_ID=MMETSP0780_2-20120614/12125_1 /TAXON_ID=652834 /ORGANISM="Palpitomonas bilix" /LENGTH=451 /DNA_ID=CAMNT_0000875793 /DNA_START=153 /DNA_END=1508 /DNA_ORIENTATION=+ /assembly_acc=CAM_ASM_000599